MLSLFRLFAIALFFSVFILSCSDSNIQFESESQKTLYGFYENLKKGEYEKAVDMCHKSWFKYWSNEQTIEFLQQIDTIKGKVIEYELEEVYPVADMEGDLPEGYYFTCLMNVKREYDSSQEMIVMIREPGGKKFEIMTYNVK